MQRLEVSCAVRRIYTSLGAKGLKVKYQEEGIDSEAAERVDVAISTYHPTL